MAKLGGIAQSEGSAVFTTVQIALRYRLIMISSVSGKLLWKYPALLLPLRYSSLGGREAAKLYSF